MYKSDVSHVYWPHQTHVTNTPCNTLCEEPETGSWITPNFILDKIYKESHCVIVCIDCAKLVTPEMRVK